MGRRCSCWSTASVLRRSSPSPTPSPGSRRRRGSAGRLPARRRPRRRTPPARSGRSISPCASRRSRPRMRLCVAAALVLAALLGARAALADDGGQRFTLSWDGRARSYLLYTPPNAAGENPLGIAPHGAQQDGAAPAAEKQVPAGAAVPGRKDPFVLFEGGSSSLISLSRRSNMGVAEALSFWTAADGCTTPPAVSEPAPGRLRRSISGPCRDGGEIVLWEIEDGEHNWPANVRFPAPDGAPRTVAAEILAFFARHSRE